MILTYYYRYIPILGRYTDRVFLRPVFFWCICLQSNTSFHEFILTLTVRICPQNLGKEMWNGTRDFRSAGRLHDYWRPVNLSFLSFKILGLHWAEREVKPAGKTSAFPKLGLSVLPLFRLLLGHPRAFIKDSPSSTCISYRLLDMLRNRLFPSRCFTYGMFIKEWKVCEDRKTSAILFELFIHERNSRPHRPHKLRCTTGALWAKKRGEHGISRVYASLGS